MSGERPPRPGVTWESVLRPGGEVVVEVEGDDGSPFGWSDRQEVTEAPVGPQDASGGPGVPNRATRRSAARLARRRGQR